MNKTITTILILGLCICQNCFSQTISKHNKQGTYVHKFYGMKWALQIKQNTFSILECFKTPISLATFNSDTIALGKVKYEDRNFIKLISDNFPYKTYKSMVITESHDDKLKDSMRIQFILGGEFGFYRRSLNVEISTSKGFISLDNSATQIVLTKSDQDYNRTAFVISEILPLCSSPGFLYNNLSPREISKSEIIIKDINTNILTIDLSSMPVDFFTRFYIDNEYCKVSPNSITWRDKVFRKISDEIIDLETLKKRYD